MCKAANTWTKDFSLNWNYDKETGSALKSLPIHGQTACSSCFFHADAGYKVAITIEHYHLNTVLAEVYGDVQLELAMTLGLEELTQRVEELARLH